MTALIAAAGAAAGLWTAPSAAFAQEPGVEAAAVAETGLGLGVATVGGEIALRGARVWSWRDGSRPGVTRLLLDRGVDVLLGETFFEADRAVVWIAPRPLRDGRVVFEVFVHAEGARTPRAAGGAGLSADRLPVSAAVLPDGPVRVEADARVSSPPPPIFEGSIAEAEAALAEATGEVPAGPAEPPLTPIRPADATPRPSEPDPLAPLPAPEPGAPEEPGPASDGGAPPPPPSQGPPPGVEVRRPIFASDGVFSISSGGDLVIASGATFNTATLDGGVIVQYEGDEGSLEIVAQRAVVFLKAGALQETLGRLRAEDVEGLYLEGGVRATDGSYTLRSEQVYYDVRTGRALALDAVFWTYEQRVRLPLYMRAEAIRQTAADEFEAERARLSASGFFRPHASIGVREATITLRDDRIGGGQRAVVDARDITLRAGRVPFFYFPRFVGDPERIPLRTIATGSSNRTGFELQTGWDPFVLLGVERPEGLSARVDVDWFEQRGFGFGLEAGWDRGPHEGSLLAYILPEDNGADLSIAGQEVEREGDTRTLLIGRNRWSVREHWDLFTEVGIASDPLVTQDLFEGIGRDGDDVQTRALLRRLDDDGVFTAELRGEVNDFIINQHRLQAPGYLVDKLPELRFESPGADPLDFALPGFLTHTWGVGYSRTRIRFSEVTGFEQGFNNGQSLAVFGILADESLGDFQRGLGLDESFVNRFDTRQELTADLAAGPLSINPFVVGRFTLYDSDFPEFSPEESDNLRLWGAGGVRLSTSFHRVDNTVRSRTFDLNRVRHIVEPSLTLWHAETNVEAEDLPIFDDEVEQLGEGSAAHLALDQTWQTQRGGPGRWRSVDVLRVRLSYTWAGDGAGRQTPIGRWFDARPELGSPQTFAYGGFTWQTTEIAVIAGEATYDPGISQVSRSALGVVLTPGRGFSGRVAFRRIEPTDATFLEGGVGYRFGDKYDVAIDARYDFIFEDFRDVRLRVLREFPVGRLGFSLRFDNITGETSFGFILQPLGASGLGTADFGGRGRSTSGFGT